MQLLEHREEELLEHRLLLEERLDAARRWKRDLRIRGKWDRYMLCDGSPDPTVPQEINTFMSLWSAEEAEDFQSVLNKSRLVLRLIGELELLLLDTPAEELGEAEAGQYTQSVRRLQELLHRKFNEATEHLLKSAAALSDIDTGNMQKVIRNNTVTLCIWANLNKNPRFRGYHFEEAELSFDLPRPLALSNIAVRLLHTDYDHISCLSQTYRPQGKEPEEKPPTDTLISETGGGEWRLGAEQEEEPALESTTVLEEERKSEERKSVLSAESHREDENEMENESERRSQEEDPSEGHSPTSLLNPAQEEELLEDDVVDLRQFTSLGGVYYFDVLVLPPQCKQVNGWSMVQLVSGGLQPFPYPQESLLSSGLGVSLQEKDMEGLRSPPVGVSLKVPASVVFFEDPHVARWDPETNNWKTDAILEPKYNPELRELTFRMDAFYTFTLMAETHLHMPYESWELTPRGDNEASLSISTAWTHLQIEIKDDQCRLAAVSEVGGDLSDVIGRWTTPLRLQAAMKKVGLNVFPAEDSGKYVSINKKNEAAEDAAYKEMALLCPSFSFAWSKWNQSCGYERIIMKVREGSGSDWSLYMQSPQRWQRLGLSESSDVFSEELYPGSAFHSTLYHMIRDHCSAEAPERLRRAHHLFLDCVYSLLSATRPLTHS
ncbi:dynein axonemal intermediate chain 7 isoform X2 [Engystomops pustulosus]|uniref:dynein axonemal intermediate chain 7 isoform X2 n=1 Tax=Engystomops pustulosus TaxID=76066 RepID=UPI003AFAAF85